MPWQCLLERGPGSGQGRVGTPGTVSLPAVPGFAAGLAADPEAAPAAPAGPGSSDSPWGICTHSSQCSQREPGVLSRQGMITGSQGIWFGRGLGLHIQALHPLFLYLGHHTLRAAGGIRKVAAVWAVHHKSFYGSLVLKAGFFNTLF